MNTTTLGRGLKVAALSLAAFTPLAPAMAETLVGTNVDNRVILGFKVDPAALDPWVPEGWMPVPFPGGPFGGGNLLVVLIDRQLQLDAEGKPADPASSRHAVFAGMGKQTDGDAVRLYVYRIYASDPAPNPYGNAVAAEIERESISEGASNGPRARAEEWEVETAGGNGLEVSLRFTSGRRSYGPSEANPWSNTDTDFSRIYRYDQLIDVVMSSALGKPLSGEMEFEAEGPELAPIFDGSHELVGVMDVPVYTRQVFLP